MTINATDCINDCISDCINATDCINDCINDCISDCINVTDCINDCISDCINVTDCINDCINVTDCRDPVLLMLSLELGLILWLVCVFGRYGGHADVCLARGIRPERSGTGRTGRQLALDGHEALLHAGLHHHLRRGVRAESGAERGAAHDGSDAHVQLQSAGELQHLQSSGEQLHGRGEQLQSTASTEYASPEGYSPKHEQSLSIYSPKPV